MEIKVIIDTNVMISFLIGKRLKMLKDKISDSSIKLILTEQLIAEIAQVTKRPKFKKYFNSNDIKEFTNLLLIIGEIYSIYNIPDICRDSKDNFLLELASISNADYLVTGDKDLLDLVEYKGAKIIRAVEFECLL